MYYKSNCIGVTTFSLPEYLYICDLLLVLKRFAESIIGVRRFEVLIKQVSRF